MSWGQLPLQRGRKWESIVGGPRGEGLSLQRGTQARDVTLSLTFSEQTEGTGKVAVGPNHKEQTLSSAL